MKNKMKYYVEEKSYEDKTVFLINDSNSEVTIATITKYTGNNYPDNFRNRFFFDFRQFYGTTYAQHLLNAKTLTEAYEEAISLILKTIIEKETWYSNALNDIQYWKQVFQD